MTARLSRTVALLGRLRLGLDFLSRYRILLAALIALGIGTSFAEGASVALVASALGSLLGGGPRLGPPILSGHPATLAVTVGVLLLVRVAAASLYGLLGEILSARVSHDMRVAVFGRFVGGAFETVSRRSIGGLLNTLEWELFAIPEAVGALAAIAMDAIAVVIYAGFLFAVSWRLASLAAVGGLMVLPLSAATTPRLHRLSERMRLRFEGLAAVHVSTVEALRTIKLFGAETEARRRQRAASDATTGSMLSIARFNAAVRVLRQVAVLAIGAVYLLLVARSSIPHSVALTGLALLYRIVPHVRSAETSITGLLGNSGRIRSTLDVLDMPDAPETGRRSGVAGHHRGPAVAFDAIVLSDVRFSYGPGAEPVLAGLDLTLPRGTFTAITGPSGGGKTTLVNLLARLHQPTGGSILVDGRPISTIGREEWLATAAFAGQDVELLRGTVRENLLMGRDDLDEDALWEALGIAQATAFVRSLDRGLEAEVGDHGRLLSGGQRQRLVLARALARAPRLLVLDEATNAVDPEMERAIYGAIRAARPDLTVLGVTHRGDTSIADVIVTVDLGRVTRIVRTDRPAARPGRQPTRGVA